MNKECSIVRDLLPLYVEQMVSADTGEFVKEHLEGCRECRGEYEQMKQPRSLDEDKKKAEDREEAAPLMNGLCRRLLA